MISLETVRQAYKDILVSEERYLTAKAEAVLRDIIARQQGTSAQAVQTLFEQEAAETRAELFKQCRSRDEFEAAKRRMIQQNGCA